MNTAEIVLEPPRKTAPNIRAEEVNKTIYTSLSKEDALAMTAEVIEKHRPALEKLAE